MGVKGTFFSLAMKVAKTSECVQAPSLPVLVRHVLHRPFLNVLRLTTTSIQTHILGILAPSARSAIARFTSRKVCLSGSLVCSPAQATASKTRSGAIFSPWITELGPPIYAPPDFDLAARVNAALDQDASTVHEQPDEDDAVLATFQADATMTPGHPQQPEEAVVIPPLPEFHDPPRTTDAASKHRFQAREHAKNRRRAAATALH